ncbi:hypothetical protein [Qaidamihabitans albus]|uniref:hypothetical protein n=1 Tax=Qaidamihabitans albus TaxID=2795733 RepID=UPI0018F254F9|nr:hypothetical protein [Qaidamihabitans albus]
MAARRFGYVVAASIGAALLFLINVRPGWEVLPFLTADTGQVLWLVNVSITAGIVVNLVYLAYDVQWFASLGGLLITGTGLACLLRIWQLFPFDFGGSSFDWPMVVRVVLIVAIAGSAIGIVAGVVSLVRDVGGRRTAGG